MSIPYRNFIFCILFAIIHVKVYWTSSQYFILVLDIPFFHSSLPEGVWIHFAITWSKTTKSSNFYVNGVLKTTKITLFDGDMTYMANNHSVYDVGLKKDDGVVLRGYLRDLAVFGKVLSSQEIISRGKIVH